jgi:metal-dependent amidase/aminoacylase/carboxypeptidase family protein
MATFCRARLRANVLARHWRPSTVHKPGYDFNNQAMEAGAAYWSLPVQRFLA